MSGSFNNNITLGQNDLFWPVLGHFFNFGSLDQLHIPYFDTCKWFLRFCYVITHVLHLDHSITTFHWYRITCLNQFSAIFMCLVYQIDLAYLIEFLQSSNKVHLFKHCRAIKNVRTIRQVLKLRTSATARYNSQLQLSSKSQNVCPSVCPSSKSYDTSCHLFFPKLGQKLEDS